MEVIHKLPRHLLQVFTTPRGEPFPNMIAETGMVIALGRSVEGNCQRFENYGSDLNPNRNVDYVLLQDYPKNIAPGQTIPVTVTYNLASEAAGSLAVSVMYKGPNTLVSGGGVDAKAGKNTVTVLVTVPGMFSYTRKRKVKKEIRIYPFLNAHSLGFQRIFDLLIFFVLSVLYA